MQKKTLVSLFISFIMITSVMGFVIEQSVNSSNKIRFNNFVFNFDSNDGMYHTKINGKELNFYSSPETVKNIELPKEFINQMIATKMIYFTADINDSLVESISLMSYEIATKVFDTNTLYVQPAFTTNETQLPVITCADATQTVPVIYVKQGTNMTSVFENNCLTLTLTSKYDAVIYEDRILYGYYGVI